MLRHFKISFYVNSHFDKLLEKRKSTGYFIIVGVIVRRDNWCETTVKGNDDVKWSSDGVVIWLRRRQNWDATEWWEECPRLRDDLSITLEGESRAVRADSLRGWYEFNASVLAWEERQRGEELLKDETDAVGSSWLNGKKVCTVRQCDDVDQRRGSIKEKRDEMTLVRLTWILLYRKMKKIHAVDSGGINGQ
jgi:hypothetical protein